jgi:hypothetical protein
MVVHKATPKAAHTAAQGPHDEADAAAATMQPPYTWLQDA